MRILVACEYSGRVRNELLAMGHDAMSCDYEPPMTPGPHYRGDVMEIIGDGWDGMIAHPPCTYITAACAWAFNDPDFDRYPGVGYHQRVKPDTLTGQARRDAREAAAAFVIALWDTPIPRVIIENPKGSLSRMWRKPDQIVHPWEFGDDASKETHFWIRGCAPVRPDCRPFQPRIVNGKRRWSNQTDTGQNRLSPGADRWKLRSATYPGIARALARAITTSDKDD